MHTLHMKDFRANNEVMYFLSHMTPFDLWSFHIFLFCLEINWCFHPAILIYLSPRGMLNTRKINIWLSRTPLSSSLVHVLKVSSIRADFEVDIELWFELPFLVLPHSQFHTYSFSECRVGQSWLPAEYEPHFSLTPLPQLSEGKK